MQNNFPVISQHDVRKGTQVFMMQDKRRKLPAIYEVAIIDGTVIGKLVSGGELLLGKAIKGYDYDSKNDYEVILKKIINRG